MAGNETSESRIVVCQCGSTEFDVAKLTKTSVSLVCARCGTKCSVKGQLTTVRVRQQEIALALKNTLVAPEPEPDANKEPEDAGSEAGGDGEPARKRVRRFALMEGEQLGVVDRALELVRIINCGDDRFREQTWLSHALEWICADFVAGAPSEAHQILDAMNAAEEDLYAQAEAEDFKVRPRDVRELRIKVRDNLAREAGWLDAEEMNDNARQLELVRDEEDGEPEKKPDLVPDGGRLLRAVNNSLELYSTEATENEADIVPEYMVREGAKPSPELLDRWARGGGYLVRFLGDERTVGPNGLRPAVCAWVSSEPPGVAFELDIEYDSATDDILGDGAAEVVELLPSDYDEGAPWAQPMWVDKREKMR